jgi:cytochrome P450
MPALIDYDPLDPATIADPYPVLTALRESTPVFWHERTGSWALTRYADCVAVLRDSGTFARDRRRVGAVVPVPSLSVQSLDPPEQAPVRGLFVSALRAVDLDAVERRARQMLTARLAQLEHGDRFDVMAEVARPLALSVAADVLGVAQPDPDAFSAVSDAIMRSMDAGLDPATAEPGRRARLELNALVERWYNASARPGVLAHVRQHAEVLAAPDVDNYVRNTARVMFQGGYSTTVAAIGNVVHVLLGQPDALARMGNPQLMRTGIEELIRFDGPVQGTSRVTTVDTRVGGVSIKAGETVLVLFAAANRDPAQFPDPDRLIIDRTQTGRHLGYGWGPHSCLGAVAAQLTVRALVTVLGRYGPRLRAAGVPRRRRTATMRVFEVLPASFRT